MTTDARFIPGKLDRDAAFYVAGHRGLAGSAIWRHLGSQGFTNLIGRSSTELDLRNRESVFTFMEETRPRYLVLAAAKVGGIGANSEEPVEFLSQNLQIQTNVLDAALECKVERLLFLGSSCIYPREAPQPIPESALLTGPLEPTNDAYAIAKIAGLLHVQAVRRQYGLPWISAMPTNLYGPGDNFTAGKSHVLPALIVRYLTARDTRLSAVTNWGTGTPRREFLHVDDAASAILYLLENYDGAQQVNVGTGTDLSIRELATLISGIVSFSGKTLWDEDKPDGTPQKLLDITKISDLGWEPSISLERGITETCRWVEQNRELLRQEA